MRPKHKRLTAALNTIWEIPEQRPSVDLSQLGAGIVHIPPYLWQERMFFKGAPDTILKLLTIEFPRRIRSSHPIFIVKAQSRLAVTACPCTSIPGPWAYIPRGTRLEITGLYMDRTSFLLENLTFNVPKDDDFAHSLNFLGVVPENRIIRRH